MASAEQTMVINSMQNNSLIIILVHQLFLRLKVN
jgi:hypothetical protein